MFDFLFKHKNPSEKFNNKYLSQEGQKIVEFLKTLVQHRAIKLKLLKDWQNELTVAKSKELEKEIKNLQQLLSTEINKKEFIQAFLTYLTNVKKLYQVIGEDLRTAGKEILADESKLKDILSREHQAGQVILQKINELKNIWIKEIEFFAKNSKTSDREQNKQALFALIKEEEQIITEVQTTFNQFIKDLQEEIRLYSLPTIAEKLQFDFDETVKQISRRIKTTIVSREGYKILCPNCLDPESQMKYNKKKKTYICSKCSVELNQEEYEKIQNIENVRGVLIDFNIRKDVEGHLVLDHHDGLDKGNMQVTATTQVLDYIKLISQDKRLASFKLLRKYYKKIMQFAQKGRMNIFANHFDLDMILAQYAFRYPNTALKYADKLVKLSHYGDLMKIDESVKKYYLILRGYGTHLILKLGKDKEAIILEILIRDLKNVLEYPSKYEQFEEEEKIRLNTAKSVLAKVNEHFKPIKGYETILLEYISTSEVKRVDAIYEILMQHKGGALNNPLILNLPLLVRTNPQHTNFNLSVNPNREGFEKLNLTVFKEPLEQAEEEKIMNLLKPNIELTKQIEEKEQQVNQIKQNPILKQLNILKGKLMKLTLEQLAVEFTQLKDSELIKNSEKKEIMQKALGDLIIKIQALTDEKQKKSLFGEFKKIEKNFFSTLPEELKQLKSELKKLPKKDKLEKLHEQNRKHNIWRVKPNQIIINPTYPTSMSYEEILAVITKNLKKIIKERIK